MFRGRLTNVLVVPWWHTCAFEQDRFLDLLRNKSFGSNKAMPGEQARVDHVLNVD